MKKYLQKFLKIKPIKLYIALSVLIFLARFLPLTVTYGTEHDSAWYLGVAKNLAHKGIYASNTNTVIYEGEGAFPSIHNKFSVQDKDGYVYFPAGVTVGPGYVVPQAILLKLFGDGWWQYRLWPMINFAIFLGILFFMVYRLGGMIGLGVFQVWLWFIPQLTVNYSFEAFSENLALTFVLLAFLILEKAISFRKNKFYFLTGILLSLSFLTKNLYVLNTLVLGPIFLFLLIKNKKNFKTILVNWTILTIGFVLPIALFEGYKFAFLVTRFGIDSWHAVNKEVEMTYQMSGSGIDTIKKCLFDEKLFMSKFKIWFDIGLYPYPFVWIGFFLLPFIIFIQKQNRLLNYLLYGAAFLSFLWFVLLSPLGWGRHIFHALVIAMLLIASSTGVLFRLKGSIVKVLALGLSILLMINIITIPKANGKLFFSQSDIAKWFEFREERGIQGFPSVVLIPQSEQQEMINFIKQNIKPQDRIYYLDAFVLAEVGTLTDRIIYPIARLEKSSDDLNNGGIAYLMLGPYQLTNYKLVDNDYFQKAQQKCKQTVFQNSHYFICKLKDKKDLIKN